MGGGDLQQSIRLHKKQLNEFTAKFFFTQLVMAVQYFHDLGIVHRDLKPENVLLSSDTEDAILKVICSNSLILGYAKINFKFQ